jgi:hypothetical protein
MPTITDRMQESAAMFAPLFQRLSKQRANAIAFELMNSGNLQGDPDPNVQNAIRQQLEQELALDSHVQQQQLRGQDAQTRLLNAMARLRPQQAFVPGPPIPAGDPAGGTLIQVSPNRYTYKGPPFAGPTEDEKAAAEAAGRQILTIGGKPTLVPKPKPEDEADPMPTPFWGAVLQQIGQQAQEQAKAMQHALPPPADVLPPLPDMDKAAKAEAWARQNMHDPRAQAILKLHGKL